MKKLDTGVEITFDKKGNIKTLTSPYWIDKVEESYVKTTLKKLFKTLHDA